MKYLLLIILLFSTQAFAATESVYGSGYANGYCQAGGSASFCINQLEARAKQDATRDADLQCRIRQGQLLTFSGYCTGNCNLSHIPGDQNTYVSCNWRCRFDCDIRKP